MAQSLHGIDFSGARQAGHDIWLAEATADADGLYVEDCESAADRFGVAERAPCLGALREFLREAELVGMDFPFGVPAAVHDCDTWEESLEWVATVATDVDGFEEACVARTDGDGDDRTYRLRATDGPVGAKSPYHWLVAGQTFHGIRDVLAPLARTEGVRVRPMQDACSTDGGARTERAGRNDPRATTLLEVYPAATLATCSLPAREYKDDDGPARERRAAIVDGLEAETPLELPTRVRSRLVDDAGGDALDAVVAAVSTYRAWQADFEPDREWDPTEGHIYV